MALRQRAWTTSTLVRFPSLLVGALATLAFALPDAASAARLSPLAAPAGAKPRIELRRVTASPRLHGLVVVLATNHGTAHQVTVELTQGGKVRIRFRLSRLGPTARQIVLRVHGRVPQPGQYRLVVLVGQTRALSRSITIRQTGGRVR